MRGGGAATGRRGAFSGVEARRRIQGGGAARRGEMPEDVRVPEGDVVWRTADRLHQALAGRVLTTCDLRWPSLATVDLTGRTVGEVVARGKHLLLRVDGEPPLTL